MITYKNLVAAALLALSASTIHAQQAQDPGALLDLLVKKKVITQQEADDTAAQLDKENAQSSANKISLSAPVQNLRLYGDARLRYEYREANAFGPNGAGSSDTANADRMRYRLRIGADVTLTDNWFLGLRLETSNDPRSTNVTLSNDAGTGATVPPFGKAGVYTTSVLTGITPTTATVGGKTVVTGFKTTSSTAVTKIDFGGTIFVGQLYLRYKPFDWLTVEGGKIPNPLITTPMVWDPDINPEGVAEQFKFTLGPWGGSASPVADGGKSDDGKTYKEVAVSPQKGGFSVDVFANLGQFVYDTASPENQLGTSAAGRNDTWLIATQVGARANFNKSTYLQIAPTFYNYTGDKNNSVSALYSGDNGGNANGINDLAILEIPVEFDWKAFGIPFSVFGDFARNFESGARANTSNNVLNGLAAAGTPLLQNNGVTPIPSHPGHNDGVAWQAGLRINQIKKKGDWTLAAYYQHSGAYALDPNLVDNDIFDSHLNMEGVVFQGGYAFTEAVTFSLQYNYGQIIDKALGTGGTDAAFTGAPIRNYNLLQIDLNVKF